MIRRWRYSGVMVLVAGLASLLLSGVALAAPTGRGAGYGYFYNKFYGGGSSVYSISSNGEAVPYPQVHDAASLISFERGKLNSGGYNEAGAAFTILTMLGYRTPPGGPGIVRPVSGNSYWDRWTKAVTYYWDQGWTRGLNNDTQQYSYGYNTYCQSPGGIGGSCNMARPDDAWFVDNGSTTGAIIFHNPATKSYYVIRRACGNPLGNLNALTQPHFNVTLSANRHGSPTLVTPGKTYSVGITIKTSGNVATDYASMEAPLPAEVNKPCTPWCSGGTIGMAGLSPTNYAYSYGFSNNTKNAIPHVGGNWWVWYLKPIPQGKTLTTYFHFTVANNAAGNSTITFNIYFYPSNENKGEAHTSISFTVVPIRNPSVIGLNGDVQAGGGLCNPGGKFEPGYPTNNSEFVQGYAGGGSYGQYVVSAGTQTSSISHFGSNDVTAGQPADILDLGTNGDYAQVCREDLLAAANAYYKVGTGFSTRPGGTNYDISGWSGLYYINGSAGIYGTVNHKLTIVETAGTLSIVNPIILTNTPALPNALPSLGIIAAGDININANVTRVDAYLFANGTIDTCIPAAGNPKSCSTPTLVVNGFFMAHSIKYSRLGPYNSNGTQLAEEVILNPQIYLNPPKFFDTTVDQELLQGQGEGAPLY